MIKAITSAVLILALVSGCASTTQGTGSLRPTKPIYVMSDRELDDYTIHNAIIMELQKRGFRVIDSGDKAPASANGALVLHYLDDWSWDMWMYLAALNIRIVDGKTSEVVATGQYRNSWLHTYPDSGKEVVKIFAQLDAAGQIAKL
jgi:hypothetical protein